MEQGPGFWSTVQKQSSSELRFPYDPNLTSICNYWKHLDLTLWSFVGKVLSLLFRLQSLVSLRVGDDWATSLSLFTFMHWRRKWQPTPVFLPGESQGQRSLVGCVYGVPQSRTWLKWLSSRLVITFLPRSKCLNFTAAITICNDFGAQENKVCHCFHCFPIYLPWSGGTDAMIFILWMLSFKSAFFTLFFQALQYTNSYQQTWAWIFAGKLTKSSWVWTQTLRCMSLLCAHVPGKVMKLFFSISSKTLSLRFNSAPANRNCIFRTSTKCHFCHVGKTSWKSELSKAFGI